MVDEFLREAHTAMMNRGANLVKVDRSPQDPDPPAECLNWSRWSTPLVIFKNPRCLDYARGLTICSGEKGDGWALRWWEESTIGKRWENQS